MRKRTISELFRPLIALRETGNYFPEKITGFLHCALSPEIEAFFFYSLIPFWRILALREKQQPPLILLRQKPGGIAKSSFVPAGRARRRDCHNSRSRPDPAKRENFATGRKPA